MLLICSYFNNGSKDTVGHLGYYSWAMSLAHESQFWVLYMTVIFLLDYSYFVCSNYIIYYWVVEDLVIWYFEYCREEDEVATNLGRDDECDIKLVVSDIFILFPFGRVPQMVQEEFYPVVTVLQSLFNFGEAIIHLV